MDNVTSNNLSRALGAVAGTVGEFARAQSAERMEQSRLAFQKAIQQQQQMQHKEDMAQRESQFSRSLAATTADREADNARQAARDAAQEKFQTASLANDRARIGIARTSAKSSHEDTVQQRVLNTYENRWRHATQATQDARERLQKELAPNPLGDPTIDAANKAVEQKYAPIISSYEKQEQQAYNQYNALSSKVSGIPVTDEAPAVDPGTPTTTAPAGAPEIRYDAQGNAFIKGPDGKPIPYTPGSNPQASSGVPGGTDFFDPSSIG